MVMVLVAVSTDNLLGPVDLLQTMQTVPVRVRLRAHTRSRAVAARATGAARRPSRVLRRISAQVARGGQLRSESQSDGTTEIPFGKSLLSIQPCSP
eukprot:COSAG02_NODE_22994_length_733_cov_0.859621_1_plen_95_part_10